MNRTLTTGALLGSLLLGACAAPQPPPSELLAARTAVRNAEMDPAVLTLAPIELKKATETLNRANALNDQGGSLAEIGSAAYVATQQARTAVAVARAKGNDAAIAGAELERERARADMRTAEARRAQAQTSSAQAQTSQARAQTAAAEQRASGAELKVAVAQANAADSQQQAAQSREQAAQLQQRLTDLQARKTDRGMLVTLGDVLFDFNRAEVRPAAQASLRKLAEFLSQYPSRRILIEGHTDNIGTAAANETLSRRRADAVDVALIGMGVAAERVATAGYGEEFPVADNTTDTSRALNRRVEVYIADNDQPVRPRR